MKGWAYKLSNTMENMEGLSFALYYLLHMWN